MFALDWAIMQYLYHALASTLIALPSSNGAYGANSLPWHISKMTGVEPPKRWLVFMELRINWCVRMTIWPGGVREDMITLIHCLSRRRNLPEQCNLARIQNSIEDSASFFTGNSIFFVSPLSNDRFQRHCVELKILFYNMTIHNLFRVNLTIIDFTVFDHDRMQPFQDNCARSKVTITVKDNASTFEYCGKRYPRSVYSQSNTVSIELRHAGDSGSIVNVHMEVGAVDLGFVQLLRESYVTNMYTWSDFTVQTYHISVEKLFQVKLVTDQESQQQNMLTVFDGPQVKMPPLLPYRSIIGHNVYVASTFQIYIVYVSKKGVSMIDINYTTNGYSSVRVMPPQKEIIVINNTGCGDNSIRAWVCTTHLSSAEGTHVQLELSSLHINGEFADIAGFSGFAVYNFINDTSVLVAHWYSSLVLTRLNFTVTSTQNQLFVSMYAYAPFTFLSCRFKFESTPCIGRFIGNYIRPSISLLPHFTTLVYTKYPPSPRPVIYVFLNITIQCAVIQIIFLPPESILIEPFIFLYFGYDSVLKISKTYLPNGARSGVHEWIDGDYHTVRKSYDSIGFNTKSAEIIGFINYIVEKIVTPPGIKAVFIFEVEQAPCTQPCPSINIFIPDAECNSSTCDICKYQWQAETSSEIWYRTNKYAVLELQSLSNDHVFDIRLSSSANLNCGGHFIDYSLGQIALHFHDTRAFLPLVKNGQVLRFKRDNLVKDSYGNIVPWAYCAEHTKMLRWGVYEYIIYTPEFCRISRRQGMEYCNKYGAYLLHIFDRQELYYVINNIMLPNKLDLAFIGMELGVSIQELCNWKEHFMILYFNFVIRFHSCIMKALINVTSSQ